MVFRVETSKITGTPDESGWAQVHEFKPEEPGLINLRGSLFAVISTKGGGTSGVESVAFGRNLITKIHDTYFGNTTASAFSALTDAVEKGKSESRNFEGEVEIAAVSLVGQVVYSAAYGGAEVAILRKDSFAKILESKSEKVISASGYPKEGDILIVGTSGFLEIFSVGSLKKAFLQSDLKGATDGIVTALHSGNDKGSLGVFFLKFEPESSDSSQAALQPAKEPASATSKIPSRTKLSASIGALSDSFSSKLTKKLPERKIYIKGQEEEKDAGRKKIAVTVGIILLVLLLVSIGFGIRQNRISKEKGRYETRLSSAQHEFDEAQSLLGLDPKRDRELFVESSTKVNEMLAEGISDSELDGLKVKLDEQQGAILGEYTQETDLFVDLALLTDGFSGDDLAASEGSLYVLDKNGKKIVRVELDTKKSVVFAGPDQVDDANLVAGYSDFAYTLNPDGIWEVGEDKKQLFEGTWGEGAMLYAYAGNLYLLNKDDSSINRYAAIPDGFADGQSWLIEDLDPDFSKVISWTIDGSIWLLDDGGRILKFSLGNQQNFKIKGVIPQMLNPKEIYTNEEQEYLYVLDPDESRIVVISKEGDYKAQYKSEKIKEAKDLTVSESEGKIILLTGDKLQSLEIEHL